MQRGHEGLSPIDCLESERAMSTNSATGMRGRRDRPFAVRLLEQCFSQGYEGRS